LEQYLETHQQALLEQVEEKGEVSSSEPENPSREAKRH
jgi:hypothetical protein